MRKVRKEIQRQALYGWLWWAPIPALILGVLAFDTMMTIETRRDDYEMNTYKREIAALDAQLAEVRTRLAGQQDLDQLTVYAEMLNLDDPLPNQIRLVPTNGNVTAIHGNLVLARTSPDEATPASSTIPRRIEMPVVALTPVKALAPGEVAPVETLAADTTDLDASLENLLESI